MKKITSLLVALMMLATFVVVPVSANAAGFDGTPATGFSQGGSGTETDPYLISDAAELLYAENLLNDPASDAYRTKFFKLTADIDYNNQEWEPFGHSTNGNRGLKGGFDGAGHVIKNLKITKEYNEIGFFGYTYGAKVKNLGIENIQIEVANTSNSIGAMGAFVGYAQQGSITNCYVKNSSVKLTTPGTSEYNGAGAFMGYGYQDVVISNCYAYDVEIATGYERAVGGFAGSCASGSTAASFENCYAAEISPSALQTRYGFGNSAGKTISAENCYSTLTGGNGTSSAAPDYTAGNSVGKAGATKEEIINAFKNVDGFCISDNENDGYPCFSTEVFDGVAADSFAEGSGDGSSWDTAYLISNAAELKKMADLFNGTSKDYREKYFKLTADIDYGNWEWEPIGHKDGYSLKGGFDGDGHVIRNIKITKPYAEVGFFGYIYGATVKNLGIENINIKFAVSGTVNSVGAFIGYAQGGSITNCYVKNATVHQTETKKQNGALGGFIGYARDSAKIENCYIYNAKIASSYQNAMGGFIGALAKTGSASGVAINNCFVADVTPIENPAPQHVYGFGNNNGKSGFTSSNCYSTLASVQGTYTDAYTAAYNASNSFGYAGESKKNIADYFKTVDGFAVSPAVNGGYPCFADEVPFKVTSVDSSDGTVKIARKAGVTTPATVYVATYDANDRLVDVATATVNADDFTFTPVGLVSGAKIKAFVWGANNNPLTYVD